MTAGLSKDRGPNRVRHYNAILIQGKSGTAVDCRSPDKGGGYWWESVGICFGSIQLVLV